MTNRESGWYMVWHKDVDGGLIGFAMRWISKDGCWESWRFDSRIKDEDLVAIGGMIQSSAEKEADL